MTQITKSYIVPHGGQYINRKKCFKETGTLVIDMSLLLPFSSTENSDLISCNSVSVACQQVPKIPKGG